MCVVQFPLILIIIIIFLTEPNAETVSVNSPLRRAHVAVYAAQLSK